jgi:hypothetical protein
MVTLDQVKCWVVLGGIGHAVGHRQNHWYYTACGSLMTGAGVSARPKRICQQCRRRLKVATLTTNAEGT